MGNRFTQRIVTCSVCGKTPDDGEFMWHMGDEEWCYECANSDDDDEKRSCYYCGEESCDCDML